MSFEGEAGVTAPLGYWDPLGLSADGDQDKFNKYRAAEIKHGRGTCSGVECEGRIFLWGSQP